MLMLEHPLSHYWTSPLNGWIRISIALTKYHQSCDVAVGIAHIVRSLAAVVACVWCQHSVDLQDAIPILDEMGVANPWDSLGLEGGIH